MATRWTKARKRWSPDIAKNCYPMYHQQFEILDEAEVTWNPWTQDQLKMVFDARHFTPGMLTDSAFWLTRCNLLFLWLTNMGRGWSLYDWREENSEWVHKWTNEALADIVRQLRPYDGSTDQAYKQWYCMNTRAGLASQPATIPTHLTQEEQARRHVELHAAYYRDHLLENVNEVGQMATDSMPAQGPYRKTFQKLLQQFVAKKFRCGRGDDVATGAYMPVARSARPSAAPSSRPSEARTSHEQWGEGPSTRTTLPRHDSSLPLHRSSSMQLRQGQTSQDHGTGLDSMPEQFLSPNPYAYTGYDAYTQGEGSQPFLSTRGIPMPEETRVPDLNQHQVQWPDSIGEGYAQDTPDVNWGDENTQRGVNTGLRGASHDHGVNTGLRGASHDLGDTVTSLVTEFFGGDVIGPSFIPPESQPYAYNYALGSQQGFATPPPTQDSQTHEAEVEYGRGLRVTRPPNRLLPSGRKERPGGRR
ncbi:uncharacterized protein [Triticum aestivum]|uniref:uncharacterized protein n=1 Tax=Triticum aestivum TaxID=4565 RepID=UPI001D01B477|nr:uncharacterized protein LOC123056959 [Triticum aestivum]